MLNFIVFGAVFGMANGFLSRLALKKTILKPRNHFIAAFAITAICRFLFLAASLFAVVRSGGMLAAACFAVPLIICQEIFLIVPIKEENDRK